MGLNYQEYTSAVGDLKVAYDTIDFARLKKNFDCLSGVGLPLEKAFNQYADAAKIWDKCFTDIDCSNESITGDLQSRWARADTYLADAERGMNTFKRAVRRAQSAGNTATKKAHDAQKRLKALQKQ